MPRINPNQHPLSLKQRAFDWAMGVYSHSIVKGKDKKSKDKEYHPYTLKENWDENNKFIPVQGM